MIPNPPPLPTVSSSKSEKEKPNEFQKIFKSIPKYEQLIKSFRCALAKPTLQDGKLWISEHHLCFKINWPSNAQYIIDFTDIVDIRPAWFAAKVENAIEIETNNQVFFFGSIQSRNERLQDIVDIWNRHVDTRSLWRKFPDMKGLKCSCAFAELKTCDVCIKQLQIQKDDPEGRRRLPEVVERKSLYLKPNASDSALGLSSYRNSTLNASTVLLEPTVFEDPSELASGFGSLLGRSHTTSRLRKSNVSSITSPHSSKPSSPLPDDSISQLHRETSVYTLNEQPFDCEDDRYQIIHEFSIKSPLSTIWDQWFCFTQDCLFVEYLISIQKIGDIKVSKWVPSNETVGDLTPVQEFHEKVPFSDIHEGFHMNTSRMIPLNHGVPFIPKQAATNNEFHIFHVSENKLGIQNSANIVSLGIVTHLRYYFTQINDSTSVKVYVQLEFTGKGSFSVPPMLAEKSTMQGIMTFYVQLEEFFSLRLKPLIKFNGCSCATDTDGYRILVRTCVPVSIQELWKSIFWAERGNLYTTTCFDVMGWTDLQFEPWQLPNTPETELKDLDHATDEMFRVPFEKVEPLMKRRLQYSVPLKHSIPFVPKSVKTEAEMTIHHKSSDSLCVRLSTIVPGIGVVTNIKIIFEVDGNQTRVVCMGSISFQKARFPIPKGIAEKSAFESIEQFYSALFPSGRRSSAVSNISGVSLPLSLSQSKQTKENWVDELLALSKEYSVYLILFLLVMLTINTLILWNVIYVVERQHHHILMLSKQIHKL